MLLQTPDLATQASPFVRSSSKQQDIHTRTTQFRYLGGVIHEDADLMVEIKRVSLMMACYKRFGPELYDMTTARLRLLKAEVAETLLYECLT